MKMRFSEVLKYYSRADVRRAIALESKNKEVAIQYGTNFGKRPDIINYENDVLDFVNNGATSFHLSEELWKNPLLLETAKDKKDIDSLRSGWDLIIDVDCKIWEYAKYTTYLLIKALLDHGVNKHNVFLKFSGNKGWHIALPFEIFPKQITFNGELKQTKSLFPHLPKIIVEFLLFYIDSKQNNYALSKYLEKENLSLLAKRLKIKKQELVKKVCSRCNFELKDKKTDITILCNNCGNIIDLKKEHIKNYVVCNKCKNIITLQLKDKQNTCPVCESEIITKFNLNKIIEVDTLLLSSRHLYRSSYSLNEKSGLISLPLDISTLKNILDFEKDLARIDNFSGVKTLFLDRSRIINREKDGITLIKASLNYFKEKNEKNISQTITEQGFKQGFKKEFKKIMILDKALDAMDRYNFLYPYFPPCIKKILDGLEDGRKRSVFILLNFFKMFDFDYNTIYDILMQWNARNKEPLKEAIIKSQFNHHKKKNMNIPPPNCDALNYYKDINVCEKDKFCEKVKNPSIYTIKMIKFNMPKIKKQKIHKQHKKNRIIRNENNKKKNNR